ncbi:MAG: hypothetical protein HUK26_05230, partial [Duodenibacillus sp.]|nr:hypothetical protein [Duodenibacillus sp.]
MEGVQQASTIAVIDIGTTKITVAVGEADDKGEVRVLGYGKVPALGVKDGSIVDIEQAVSSIREAVDEAERVAERKIERIWAAQSGKLLHSFNNEGLVVLQDGEVSEKDAQQARAMATSYDYRKDPFLQNILKERARRKDEGRLKAEEQGRERPPEDEDRFDPSDARLALYYVKGYTLNSDPALIQDPVGMHGDVLRAHAHLAVGSAHVCDNITKCLMLAGLQVNGIGRAEGGG